MGGAGDVTFSPLKRASVEVFRQDMLCFTGILHACPRHVNICCLVTRRRDVHPGCALTLVAIPGHNAECAH